MTQRHVVQQERQRKVAQPKPGEPIFFFVVSRCRPGWPQEDFSIVFSMTPNLPPNGGNGLQHRSASSCSLQGDKERGDQGTAPGQSTAGAAPKKNGDQAKRVRAHGVMKHPSHSGACCRSAQQARGTAAELRTAGPSLQGVTVTIWTWTWAHVAAFTSGRIFIHNLLELGASTQVLHTNSGESLKVGGVTSHSLRRINGVTSLAEIRALKLWTMRHRLLAQHLPGGWNCSFIQCYGRQVASAAPAGPFQEPKRACTKSGCPFVLQCKRHQDTGQRNSASSTASPGWTINQTARLRTCTQTHTLVSSHRDYLRCLLSTINHGCVPTCILGRALPQRLPVLLPVDYRHWTCICTHTRANWRSVCWHCFLWTTLQSFVPAHIPEQAGLPLPTLSPADTGPGCIPARISGRVGAALTGVVSCRQVSLDKYLHTCSGKLAQRLPALDPVNNRPQLCRVSWSSAYRHCILLTTGPGCVPERIQGRACSPPKLTTAASCPQPPLDAYLHDYLGELAQRLLT